MQGSPESDEDLISVQVSKLANDTGKPVGIVGIIHTPTLQVPVPRTPQFYPAQGLLQPLSFPTQNIETWKMDWSVPDCFPVLLYFLFILMLVVITAKTLL